MPAASTAFASATSLIIVSELIIVSK